jgi:hypothetical protein
VRVGVDAAGCAGVAGDRDREPPAAAVIVIVSAFGG